MEKQLKRICFKDQWVSLETLIKMWETEVSHIQEDLTQQLAHWKSQTEDGDFFDPYELFALDGYSFPIKFQEKSLNLSLLKPDTDETWYWLLFAERNGEIDELASLPCETTTFSQLGEILLRQLKMLVLESQR